jgi:hypothetical protein
MLAKERNEIAGNKNSFMGSIITEGRQMTEKEREEFRRPPYWPVLNAKKNKEEQKNGK